MKVSYPKGSYKLAASIDAVGDDDRRRIIVKAQGDRNQRDDRDCVYSIEDFTRKIAECGSALVDLIVQEQPYLKELRGVDLAQSRIGSLSISLARHSGDNRFRVADLAAQRINVTNSNVRLENVDCQQLECRSDGLAIELLNSRIGILKLVGEGNRFSSFRLESCSVLSLSIAPAIDFGDFVAIETIFASRLEGWPIGSLQAEKLSNFGARLDRASMARLHKWAQESGNSKIAHLARGYEVAFEVAEADRQEKLFFFLWGLAADYGLSLWKPLVWLVALFLAFSLLLCVSGTELGIPQSEAFGRRQNLVGSTCVAQFARAVAGASESIFSPFAVFSTRRLVVPTSGTVAIIQFFYSYMCIALLFTFGFAVRRRFKVG